MEKRLHRAHDRLLSGSPPSSLLCLKITPVLCLLLCLECCWFVGWLCAGLGGWWLRWGCKSPWKAIYPLPSTDPASTCFRISSGYFQPWGAARLTSGPSYTPLRLHSQDYAFITCWLTLLFFPALIAAKVVRSPREGHTCCCLNKKRPPPLIMEPKGIWNWVWRLHQGHLLHPSRIVMDVLSDCEIGLPWLWVRNMVVVAGWGNDHKAGFLWRTVIRSGQS